MVHKGSVAVEGISLTIADFDGEDNNHRHSSPHLLANQSAHALMGAPLNIEADVLVKMAHAQMQAQKKPELKLTEAGLVANGY